MQEQPENKGKEKFVVNETEQEAPSIQPSLGGTGSANPRIRVTIDSEKVMLNGSDLLQYFDEGQDLMDVDDRGVISAVEKYIQDNGKPTKKLLDYSLVRLHTGNWLLSPPAVYG